VSDAQLLIVEDDSTLREGLRDAFLNQGYRVVVAADGVAGAEQLARGGWDLVVLDLMLPGRDGLDLLRDFRLTDAGTPVVILTARGDESDKVLGLELGADDYVTKPFGLRELIARVRARLRRRDADRAGSQPAPFRVGAATVDLGAYRIERNGEAVGLSPREAAILGLLHREIGRAVSRNEILDHVWGGDTFVTNRTIDTHVLNLRRKLEPDPQHPRHLLTVHGVGYRLEAGGSE